MTRSLLWMLPAAAFVAGATAVASKFGFFILPVPLTGEADRLFAALALEPGQRVADVGAGKGGLAIEVAKRLGPAGRVFATELDEGARTRIAARASRAGAAVEVRRATVTSTGLDDGCCDAVYLRAVFHHIDDREAFAASLARAVVPGGRIAIVDFPPGALWFHGADHGVSADTVREAFWSANWMQTRQIDDWGGGMYLLVFERVPATR